MPKRSFLCTGCGEMTSKWVSPSEINKKTCTLCFAPLKVLPPALLGSDVTELVDSNRNIRWKQDQEEKIRERSLDYFYEHEIPRLINEYSLKVCLEEGWVYYDEKGTLQIRTRPPERD